MKTTVVIATCALALGLVGSATAKHSSDATIRRASEMRTKAKDLRDAANHLRDGEGVEKANVTRAVKMEKEADTLERRANQVDGQEWPPQE